MSGLTRFKRWSILLASGAMLVAQGTDDGKPVTAPLNPAFIAWQKAKEKAKEATRQTFAFQGQARGKHFGRMPSPINFSHLKGPLFAGHEFATFPATYDLRALNQVTAVRDQSPWGTCWAHAAMAALESSQLKAGRGTFDLSEWHLAWYCYNDFTQNPSFVSYTNTGSVADTFDGGGWDGMAVALLARGTGAVNESDSPYQSVNPFPPSSIPTGNEPVSVKLQEALFVRSNEDDTSTTLPIVRIKDVKTSVMRYGGVSVGITADDGMAGSTDSDFYNAVTHAFYDPTSTAYDTNHAVVIVGWDDNYPATNFAAGHYPPHNGAWIIRNSWGADWGASGYFYASYDSKTYDGVAYVYDAKSFNRIYQYDPLGWISSTGYGDTKAYFSNVFTAKAFETISAISFYATDINSTYQISIRKDVTGDPSTGTLVARPQCGKIEVPGYRMIPLTHPVTVTRGQKFAVIVKLNTTEYTTPIAIEAPIQDFSDKATAQPGESYISHNGTSWTDLTVSSSNSNVCLKAFAVPSTHWWGSVLLNGGADCTRTPAVTATLTGGFDNDAPTKMCFSWNGNTFSRWENFSLIRNVNLPAGDGMKTLYVKFMDDFHRVSPVYRDSIILDVKGVLPYSCESHQ